MVRISVDIGGTFTDCVVEDEHGQRLHKSPTTPDDPPRGVLDVLAKAAGDEPLEAFLGRVERLVHGTTLATNVLLTGRGAQTGLLTTAGFRDVIEIRRGIRNLGTSMFDQFKPAYRPLVPRARRLGLPERTLYTGEVEQPLDEQATAAAVDRLVADGCDAIAIGFVHSYANPENERRAKAIVQERSPETYVVCSHEILPTLGEFERFSTTVVSAYIGPSVSRYLRELEARLRSNGLQGALLIMLSGALMQAVEECHERAAELLVSGPAAAPSAALRIAGRLGHRDILEVDMGGTSFDMCVIRDGRIPTTKEAWVGEERVANKMVDVGAIGAGGGSIAWIDGLGLLRVGPQSAGADPGPAAYGRSELPTVTDADLVLGYVPADYFLGGELQLDVDHARAAIASVGEPLGLDVEQAAEAIFKTVTGVMADAVTEVCTKKGLDVRSFVMVAGGGAGGIHGAEIARQLGIPEVICPATAPVLSAMGMLTMDVGRELTMAGVWDRTAVTADEINATFGELVEAQVAAFGRTGIEAPQIEFQRSLAMRYLGQFHEISVELPDRELDGAARGSVETAFHERYRELYGYSLPWRMVEILECHLRGSVPQAAAAEPAAPGGDPPALSEAQIGERSARTGGDRRPVPVYRRELLRAGHSFAGPALVDSAASTVLVPEGFDARADADGNLVLVQRGVGRMPESPAEREAATP
ncbi:MAG: N-methylhydantoinase [Thermoleophilaceae bacterium]|nr:N-methylhydantoinase [Thermoleophilaceae bacterium]